MTKVIIYTHLACQWCRKLKRLLDQNGVRYAERDVSASQSVRTELAYKLAPLGIPSHSVYGVPAIDIDGTIVLGYDEPWLRELLKLTGGVDRQKKAEKVGN